MNWRIWRNQLDSWIASTPSPENHRQAEKELRANAKEKQDMFLKKAKRKVPDPTIPAPEENNFLGYEIRWVCKEHPFPVFVFDYKGCSFWVKMYFRGEQNKLEVWEIHIDGVDFPKYLWNREEMKHPFAIIKEVERFLATDLDDKFERILRKLRG